MPRNSLPPVGFRFDLKFFDARTKAPYVATDEPDASFQEVSGLSVDFEVQTVKDGNLPTVLKLPVKPVFPDLVLKRGLLLETQILTWIFSLLRDSSMQVQPLELELSLKNEVGDPLINFRFFNAWPKKWSLGDFNAMESSLVIETLELSYQSFEPKFP